MARPEREYGKEPAARQPAEERYVERPAVPAVKPTSTSAILSFILGILALIADIINIGGVIGPVVGIFLSVLAIVFGAVGIGQTLAGTHSGTVWAVIGIILGLIALALGILAAVFGFVVFSVRLVT